MCITPGGDCKMKHIFRAYDIRGIWGKDLDIPLCLDIGRGLGSFLVSDLGIDRVAVGYDVRTTSPAFHGVLTAGLLSTGVDVISTGMCSFGVAMFAGLKSGSGASCFITASHLEPEWNGLKVYFGDGVGFPEEHIMAVRDRVLSGEFSPVDWKEMGHISHEDHLPGYVDFWSSRYGSFLKGGDPLRVGVDCGGGAMTLSAGRVLRAAGLDVRMVNGERDPFFRGRPSEPKPENLGRLRELVLDEQLAFGVAFDGDGDRAVVVDDAGEFLSTDRLGIILASSLVKRHGGGMVLANVESSMAVEDVLVPLGARVKRIKVGHTFLTLEAKKEGAIFGVERSGHLIIPEHVLFDDAITAPLELARILKEEGKSLSGLASGVPQYPSLSRAFDCPDSIKFRVLDELREEFIEAYDRVNTMDGVRVDLDDGWVLIRCSNTSPVIRMTVEARSDGKLRSIEREFGEILGSRIASNG